MRPITFLMGRALAVRLVAAAAACLALPASASAVGPGQQRAGRAFFDVRQERPSAHPAGSARARRELDRALGPQGLVVTDPLSGGTRTVAKLAGFLTEPAAGDPAAIALGYVRSHAAALGLGEADIERLRLVRRRTTLDGVTHLTWAQTFHGIPAFDNDLRANVTADGRLVSILGSPRGGLSVPSTRPHRTARAALAAALQDSGARRGGRRVGRPRLVLFGEQAGARLAWRLRVKASPTEIYDYVVDAASGRVLRRANQVDFASALAYEYYPGAAAGGTQASQSLDSWLAPGATTLTGNNAHAYLDLNDTGAGTEVAPGSYAFAPVSSPLGACPASGCAWRRNSAGSWSTNQNEAANQAFYYANKFHDHLAQAPISFTSASGNFEGADKVKVEVDDGASTGPDGNHINNANFSTPPDGAAPTMQMYLFGNSAFSDVNGADDATIVYHEYTHGLTNRLITDSGGYGALSTAQAGAMGEAWSDWYAMDYLAQQGYESGGTTNGSAQVGVYTDGGQHLIRHQGIDCPVGAAAPGCPGSSSSGHQGGFTYADFGHVGSGGPEVHDDGEIWGETLWDLRRRLIADHPADGAQRAEMLVTHSMDLAPPEPSFLEMRNSILQEDSVAYGGADQPAIWQVFANRGMGWFASTTGSTDTAPVADFSAPPSGGGTGTVSGTVTDVDTHGAVAGATLTLGGTGLASTTGIGGAYSIAGVPAGTYPQLIVTAPGYDRTIRSVSVASGQNSVDAVLRRDWASSAGGAYVRSFTGTDYSGYGCGPGQAIDQSSASGWSTDATGTDQSIVVALPQPIDVNAVGIDPGAVCGDDPGSGLRGFKVETSSDGAGWSLSTSGTLGASDGHVDYMATGVARGTRFVRLTMRSNQAGTTGPGSYIDVAELEVYGTPPPIAGPAQIVPPPQPPAAPPTATKPGTFTVTLNVQGKQKLKRLLKRGLPVDFVCSSRCTAAASLKLKRNRLGAGSRDLLAGGKSRIVVRVSKRAAKKALRRGRKWKLTLRTVVTGPEGRRSFAKTVVLSR